MANLIQIKRAVTALAPASLNDGEMAYSANTTSESLFIGNPRDHTVTRIGGMKFGHVQSAVVGTLTANSTIIVDDNLLINELRIGTTSANAVVNATTFSIANVVITGTLKANGSIGSALDVLKSDGTGKSYWAAPDPTNSAAGSNTQVQFNDSGVQGGVSQFTFNKDTYNLTVANTILFGASGNTINNTVYTGKSYTSNTANSASYIGSLAAANVVSDTQLTNNLASYQTTAGLSANVATLTSNSANYIGSLAAASVVSSTDLSNNLANYQTTAGLSANVATLTANNTSYVGSTAAADVISATQLSNNLANYQTSAGLSANVAKLTANNTSYVGSTAAADVISATQLSNNLANYQTSAGLSANVAKLTANNAGYLNSKVEADLNVNSALTTNAAMYLNGQPASYYTNASNFDTGTINTSRLPATANITTAINVGGNVNLTTSSITVGNSSVNTYITSTAINTDGTLDVLNTVSFSNTLSVTGNATFSNNIYVAGDILPSANETYNLGSTTKRFKDLFLSGSTLTLGNTTISAADGDLKLTGGLQVNTGATFGNTVSVNGTFTAEKLTTLTGAVTVSNTINVVGFAAFSNSVNFAGSANVQGSANIAGTLGVVGNTTITGDFSADGNVVIGSATSDVISFKGRANTDLLPSANITYNLGTEALSWANVHANNVHATYANIDRDLTVSGNLIVTGTLATINVATLSVTDALIQLAANNNASDTLDIGFYGNYQVGGGDHEHTGLFRDATDGLYKLFDGLTAAPGTTVDTSNTTFNISTLQAYLNSGALVSNSATVTITANSTVNVNITANTLTLGSALVGTSGGTGLSSYAAEDILVANSANGFRKLSKGSDGYVLQVVSGALAYGTLDGGTF